MPRRAISWLMVMSEITPLRTPGNRKPSRANGRVCSMTASASRESGTRKSDVAPTRPFIASAGMVQTSPSIWLS
jgi:hypothetical protein